MMRFLASGAAGRAGLSAAEIFSARQFVAGIIDHFVGTNFGCGVRTEPVDLVRKNHEDEEHEKLQRERLQHAPIGHERVGSFAGQPNTRARKRRTDAGDKFIPTRGPLDQQLGRIVTLNDRDLFELESFGHASVGSGFGAMPGGNTCQLVSIIFIWISIWSPNAVSVLASVWLGNSRTEAACMRTGEKRQGWRLCSRCTTRPARSK